MQASVAPEGSVTVHVMTPPGAELPLVPATSAVRVVVPPNPADVELKETVGTKSEIPKLTGVEVTKL